MLYVSQTSWHKVLELHSLGLANHFQIDKIIVLVKDMLHRTSLITDATSQTSIAKIQFTNLYTPFNLLTMRGNYHGICFRHTSEG